MNQRVYCVRSILGLELTILQTGKLRYREVKQLTFHLTTMTRGTGFLGLSPTAGPGEQEKTKHPRVLRSEHQGQHAVRQARRGTEGAAVGRSCLRGLWANGTYCLSPTHPSACQQSQHRATFPRKICAVCGPH